MRVGVAHWGDSPWRGWSHPSSSYCRVSFGRMSVLFCSCLDESPSRGLMSSFLSCPRRLSGDAGRAIIWTFIDPGPSRMPSSRQNQRR